MDKREAYRICHVYPDVELHFSHTVKGVVFEGTIRKLSPKECKTYYPFTVETTGMAHIANSGIVTCYDIGRRYVTIEDAVIHIFNGMNENPEISTKYSKLEDILFE